MYEIKPVYFGCGARLSFRTTKKQMYAMHCDRHKIYAPMIIYMNKTALCLFEKVLFLYSVYIISNLALMFRKYFHLTNYSKTNLPIYMCLKTSCMTHVLF